MANWAVLSSETHRDKRFQVPVNMRHTAAFKLVPVLKAELPRVVPQYVLAFAATGETEQALRLVALLGSTGQHHLYLEPDGSWHGSYIPAMLRGYPFKTVSLDQDRLGLAIDADVLTDDPALGQPLFDAQGALSEKVTRYAKFLEQCHVNQAATDQAVKLLKDHGLLCPWSEDSRDEAKAEGLWQIDKTRLDALSSAEVAALKGAPLAIAYAQIYARGQLDMLMQRAQDHTPATSRGETRPSLLEEIGQETIIFDFDT